MKGYLKFGEHCSTYAVTGLLLNKNILEHDTHQTVIQLISGVNFSISKNCREGNELDHELIDIHSTATDWRILYITFTKEYK